MQGGATTTLSSNAAYSGLGGSFGEMTGATLGGTTFSASYDLLDRATDLKVKRTSDNATIFDQPHIRCCWQCQHDQHDVAHRDRQPSLLL